MDCAYEGPPDVGLGPTWKSGVMPDGSSCGFARKLRGSGDCECAKAIRQRGPRRVDRRRGRCSLHVAHCRRANAGLFYENREEFVEAMRLMARSPELRERLGEAGRRYVEQHYRWDAVIARFERLIGRVR